MTMRRSALIHPFPSRNALHIAEKHGDAYSSISWCTTPKTTFEFGTVSGTPSSGLTRYCTGHMNKLTVHQADWTSINV